MGHPAVDKGAVLVFQVVLSRSKSYRSTWGRRNEGRAKRGNADGKGNFGLMNYIFKVVDVNPQISKPRNSYKAEIKNLYAVVTISLQIVDNKWFTMPR